MLYLKLKFQTKNLKFAAKRDNSTKHHFQSHNFPKVSGTQQQKQ